MPAATTRAVFVTVGTAYVDPDPNDSPPPNVATGSTGAAASASPYRIDDP